jgi:hypothetical protein
MRVLPEFVFVNCCHLPAFQSPASTVELSNSVSLLNRSSFAAQFAEELMRIGIDVPLSPVSRWTTRPPSSSRQPSTRPC